MSTQVTSGSVNTFKESESVLACMLPNCAKLEVSAHSVTTCLSWVFTLGFGDIAS